MLILCLILTKIAITPTFIFWLSLTHTFLQRSFLQLQLSQCYIRLKNTHSLKKIKRYTQSTGTADGCKLIETSGKSRLNYKGLKGSLPLTLLLRHALSSSIITTIVNQPIYNHVTLSTVLISALQMSIWFFIYIV